MAGREGFKALETMEGYLEEATGAPPVGTAREKAMYWANIATAEFMGDVLNELEKIAIINEALAADVDRLLDVAKDR